MAGRLSGQVAVVTGASRGIGRATAIALAREGAAVVVAARTADDLTVLAEEIEAGGGRALPVAGDLSTAADVDRLAEMTIAAFGRVDVLVNNAGVGRFGTLDTLTVEDYDHLMNINMRATFLCTKAFYPGLIAQNSGAIIFVGSVAGLRGLPEESIYCATKHAQYGFAMALDHECRAHNVKVSYIAPGGVNSHFGFDSGARTPGDPKLLEYLDNEDIAAAVVFAATQPAKGRIFLMAMRPMRESI